MRHVWRIIGSAIFEKKFPGYRITNGSCAIECEKCQLMTVTPLEHIELDCVMIKFDDVDCHVVQTRNLIES